MKIAVWLDTDMCETVGGGFSYHDRLVHAIDNYSFDPSLDICFVSCGNVGKLKLKRETILLEYEEKPTLAEKIKTKIPLHRQRFKTLVSDRLNECREQAFVDQLRKNGVRLVYHITPAYSLLSSKHLIDFPFITTHWDIGHRSTYAFPEVASAREIEYRDHYYNNTISHAFMVFCESKAGKEELLHYTTLNPDKIKIVPIFPGKNGMIDVSVDNQQRILSELGLQKHKFFYYPAQFWAHKNHYTLVCAFEQFVKKHSEYKLILTGSDKGNLQYIKETVKHLHIQDSVVFANFVSPESVNTLYRNATAMVMPTVMGPTNMPPLEAMDAGCPVICSDFPGHREELGDAAIYVNPLSQTEILSAFDDMIEHRENYAGLIKKQKNITPHTIENALRCINNHLLEAAKIRSLWQ